VPRVRPNGNHQILLQTKKGKRKMKKVKKHCETCGAEMVGTARRRFCDKCTKVRKYEATKRNHAKYRRSPTFIDMKTQEISRDVRRALHVVTNENLQDYFNHHQHDPRKRPDWCSPVRWRIFLRFIQRARYYSQDGELHPGQARGIATVKFSPLRRNY
jgi:hypothetical protein